MLSRVKLTNARTVRGRPTLAGDECGNSDVDFCNAERKELPVIKISSCEGREDCQQLKPKGTQASLR